MPIAATLPLLQQQLAGVMRLKLAGNPDTAAALLTAALSTSVATGLLTTSVPPIPTIPTGAPLALNTFKGAFNMGDAANVTASAQKIADGVKAICPIVPPTGYALLFTQLQQAMNLKLAGTPEAFAALAAAAIIAYYTAGLVV